MKKIVIAIDSFKGCLTSLEAGTAIARGVHRVLPDCTTIILPVADGGEGLLEVLVLLHKAHYVSLQAHDPLMQLRPTRYALTEEGDTAFIEMAAISGLPLVPDHLRNPMVTTTYGTGELIRDALDRGCRSFLLGIGGSATNDAGLGMLQALGYQFRDAQGHLLGSGGQIMEKVSSIDTTLVHPALQEAQFTVACDVQNPFYGPQGAAYVFARQKGANDKMIASLDRGMRHLAQVISKSTGLDFAELPGTGAAGGLGGTLFTFLHAQLTPGAEMLLQSLRFDNLLQGADLVLTGEGKSDRQTLDGKVPWAVLQHARKHHIPVVILAGSIEDITELNEAGFRGVFSITPGPMSLQEAMLPETAKQNLEDTAAQVCALFSTF